MLEKIIKEIRNYEGVTRKNPICTLTNCFHDIDNFGKTIISFGDDSAVLKSNGNYMLFAADGIWSKLIENDPVWAGYCAVLANVNDIYAMGGRPLALTNVMSSKDTAKCPEVVEGIAQGCKKFKVPMVGGHLHPNTTILSLSISIVGEAKKLLTSFDAIAEQDILIAIDITGEQHKTFLNWDSTSMKTSDVVISHLERMVEIAERGLATAAKDVSNPGILGTIGMLLETSGVGATIDIDAIPRPETVDFIDWLKMYPGFGFIITCAKENSKEIQSIFKEENIACETIGSINEGSNMILKMENEKKILFDFSKDIITGITKDSLPK
ncbi:MAG: methanogenesis marker 2 protein [Candidatus Methanofastidiosia archaeon]